MSNQRKFGIILILLSGLCFGALGIFGKLAYQNGVTPGELLSLRFLFAGLILFAYFTIKNPNALLLTSTQYAHCILLGTLGYAVFSSCFFIALQGLSASLTVLLLYTYPVFVTAGGWLLFNEKIHRSRLIALPMVLAGLILLIWGDIEINESSALLFGLASAVFYSIYILASSRWLQGVNSFVAAMMIQLSAGISLSITHWRDAGRFVTVVTENWFVLLGISCICTLAAMSLFLAGLKRLKNWEVSVLSTFEPVTGILLAVVFLGERLSMTQVIGALAVLSAFLLVAKPTQS